MAASSGSPFSVSVSSLTLASMANSVNTLA
jgi:hypothetical protein